MVYSEEQGMKIYFAGSIRGGRSDQELYSSIIQELGKYGVVLTEHVADKTITHLGEVSVTPEYIFLRDIAWLRECDVMIAEVSTPSLGVGYEIAQAELMGKKIICLYRLVEGKSLSAMISGNFSLELHRYKTFENISEILSNFFSNFAKK